MSTPPRLSPPLSTRSQARERIYRTLLENPVEQWTVSSLARRLPGLSAEAVRTTLYLLQRDRLVEQLAGQRRLTFQLTDNGVQALRAVLDRWRARGTTSSSPERPSHDVGRIAPLRT